MKKILSFDIDNTLNEPKMPIFPEMAELLATLSQKYIIAPISGQKYDQFLIQIINNLPESANLDNFHLFVAQGTRLFMTGIKSALSFPPTSVDSGPARKNISPEAIIPRTNMTPSIWRTRR